MSTTAYATHDLAATTSSDVLEGQAATASRRQTIRVAVGPGGGAVLTTTLRPSSTRAATTDLAARRPLNLVAKPLAATRVVRAVPEGALLTRAGGSANGYARVVFEGCRGYAPWGSLVRPGHVTASDRGFGARATTTAEAALRTLPSMGSDVRGVIPAGTAVRHYGELVAGFLEVEAPGGWGWVRVDALG